MKRIKLKPSKNQMVQPRVNTSSARQERQKYTSDTYRDKYAKIRWNKKTI